MSADGRSWFLVNASPDLRAQIEAFPALQPGADSSRNSPIAGVILTNADLDHVLGLLLLREGAALRVYATPAVRVSVEKGLRLHSLLDSFSGVEWCDIPTHFEPLGEGIDFRAVPLPGNPPPFGGATLEIVNAPTKHLDAPRARSDAPSPRSDAPRARSDAPSPCSDAPRARSDAPRARSDAPRVGSDAPRVGSDAPRVGSDAPSPRSDAPRPRSEPVALSPALASHAEGHSIACEFLDRVTGARLLIAPDVAAITPELEAAARRADAVLLDGTFWSDDELQRVKPSARTAAQMGHVPVNDGGLALLARCTARRRIFLHINNTNPILAPTPEREEVERAGVEIGSDGVEFEL